MTKTQKMVGFDQIKTVGDVYDVHTMTITMNYIVVSAACCWAELS